MSQQFPAPSDAFGGAVNRRFELQPIVAGEHEKPLSNPLLYLPPPPTRFPLHARLVLRSSGHSHSLLSRSPPRVLVIGDLHGCLDELLALVKLAGMDAERGDVVVAVGDLVTKGPKSREVIQWLRENGHFAVLGNHDQLLLKNALLGGRLDSNSYESDASIVHWDADSLPTAEQQSSAEYARMYYARMNGFHLAAQNDSEHYRIAQSMTAEELDWVASLPISIDLSDAFPAVASSSASSGSPHAASSSSSSPSAAPLSWTVVHAGLVPSIPLLSQHPFHVTTTRNFVSEDASGSSSASSHEHEHAHGHHGHAAAAATLLPSETTDKGRAWSMREGDPVAPPSLTTKADDSSPSQSQQHRATQGVLFGHDAPRGFQYPNRARVGLDTGACNGLHLTGLRLPDESVWSVQSTSSRVPGNSDLSHVRPPPQPIGVQLAELQCSKPALAEGTETTDKKK